MIKLYRSLMMVFAFSLFGVGSLTLGLIIFPLINIFSKKENKKFIYSKVIHKLWRFFIIYILTFTKIIKINIKDKQEIQNIKQSVIVCTHPSYIDVVILLGLIPNTTCFVAPKIVKNKFFRNVAKSMFLISGNPLDEIVSDAKEALDMGFNVLIFPMGTRHRKNEFPKIRKGASLIALEAKKDIVILNMTTDTDFLQVHQPFYDAGEKQVNYELSLNKTIKTSEFIEQKTDEVQMKKEITNIIKTALYG